MTDAELQAIRKRLSLCMGIAGMEGMRAWYQEDVPALLEAVDAADAARDSYLEVGIGLQHKLVVAEAEFGRLRRALTTIRDYGNDTPAELHVAQELLDDIDRVATKALKPEGVTITAKIRSLWGSFDCPKCGAKVPWKERQLKTRGHYLGLREVYCEGCGYISRAKDVGFPSRPPLSDRDGGACPQSP